MSRKSILVAVLVFLMGAITLPAAAVSFEQTPWTLDQELGAIADQVPGFGGLYYDAQGRANVFLTNLEHASVFEQMGEDVVIHQGDYDFRDLQNWRLRARPSVLGIGGVVTLDVDETTNRVTIGIDRDASPVVRAQVEAALAFNLIPREAVILEPADPIYPAATLRDQLRPVIGSLQIHFGNFLCTLGFNASRGGVSGFVTNSHCTNKQGGVGRGTDYFQPLSPAFIGFEVADPDYLRNQNGCPQGSKCRFSDSSFAAYDSGGLSGGNVIARTASRGQFGGSIDITGSFDITGFASGNSPVGTEVNKIGRTTGWTFGPVTDSCVDVGVQGSNIVQLCQDIVTGGVGGGDSGSPVFTWGGGSTVTLAGILWGGNGAGTLFVYSPYSAIRSELGLD